MADRPPSPARAALMRRVLGCLTDRPKRRAELAAECCASERAIRGAIAALVKDGHPIASDGRRGFRFCRPGDPVAERRVRALKAMAAGCATQAAGLARSTRAAWLRQLALELEDPRP